MSKLELFEIKEDHIKLIKNLNISWYDCEYGAPCVDPKRPYGNSDVDYDIANILNYDLFESSEGDKYLSKEQEIQVEKLHKEMETVLQICCCTLEFETGVYVKQCKYDNKSWLRIGEKL